jgi:hypothetical protein
MSGTPRRKAFQRWPGSGENDLMGTGTIDSGPAGLPLWFMYKTCRAIIRPFTSGVADPLIACSPRKPTPTSWQLRGSSGLDSTARAGKSALRRLD